jgi:hypothetical protein
MPLGAFETTIPVLERAKTVHALDCAATVIGTGNVVQWEMFWCLLADPLPRWNKCTHKPLCVCECGFSTFSLEPEMSDHCMIRLFLSYYDSITWITFVYRISAVVRAHTSSHCFMNVDNIPSYYSATADETLSSEHFSLLSTSQWNRSREEDSKEAYKPKDFQYDINTFLKKI